MTTETIEQTEQNEATEPVRQQIYRVENGERTEHSIADSERQARKLVRALKQQSLNDNEEKVRFIYRPVSD